MKKTSAESSKHPSKQRRTRLWRQLNLIEAASYKRKRLTPLSSILKLLARGLDMTESNKLIRNAIASLDEQVRQRCLEKSKSFTLEMANDIGRMFEVSKDGMQMMSGEDPNLEVKKITWKNGSSKKKNEQVQKCYRCGYNAHKPQEKYPAGNELCNKCRKIGHLSQVYRSHIISAEGLKPDPEKVRAMKNMPLPVTKDNVRRFLRSIQYLAKFLPTLAEVETPLQELARKDVLFLCDKSQAAAFQKLKGAVSRHLATLENLEGVFASIEFQN